MVKSSESGIEDQTVEGFEVLKHPKFEVYNDKAGEFRFRLKAKNGQIIATSEGYKAKSGCLNFRERQARRGTFRSAALRLITLFRV